MKKVKVDLQCPFCGFCKVLKVPSYRKGIYCPSCKQSIFLSWATGIEGETDKHGYYFHAHEPLGLRRINQEFKGCFDDEPRDYRPHKFSIKDRL